MRKYVALVLALCLAACTGSPKEDTTPTISETFSGEWSFQKVGDTLKYQKSIQLADTFFAAAVRKGGVIVNLKGLSGMDTLRLNGKVAGYYSRENMPRGSFNARRYYVPASLLQKGDNQLDLKVLAFQRGGNRPGMQGGLRDDSSLTITTAETADRLAMTYEVARSEERRGG